MPEQLILDRKLLKQFLFKNMIKQVKIEIKNSINQIEFKFTFAAILLVSLISILLNCYLDFGHNILSIRSYIDNSMYVSIKARAIINIFQYLSPLLVMTVYSSSKWKEEKNGMQTMIITRIKKKDYYVSKFIANFVLVFSVILFSGIINLIISYIVYPAVGFDNRWGMPVYDIILGYDQNILFDFLRIQNPLIYILSKILLVSIFLAAVSNIPYSLSFIKPFSQMEFIQICIMSFIGIAGISIIGIIFDLSFLNYISYMVIDANISFLSVCVSVIVLNLSEILILIKGIKKYETIH
ncbi:hypothetical protein [Thomasclavelia sp.]|uniref:hypothetical protein n=1 Tax=Thomasclavelia sp. TaxID=3025757 RepID=UPI0025DF939F|nr:hypothetical protein [Thomasclavelia sp.]